MASEGNGTLVFATTGGWQVLRPGGQSRYVETGETVRWYWPLVGKNHEDYDPDHRLPREWRVVEGDGEPTKPLRFGMRGEAREL